MTAQHTPGPWEVDLCDNGAFAVYVPPVVDMGWMTVITSRGQLPDRAAESHANARLIAAAPDLLAVVIHARNVLPNEHWADDTRRMLDAAIASATHKEGA